MTTPNEMMARYPLEAWLVDLEYWVARGGLPIGGIGPMVEYFFSRYPNDQYRTDNSARLHTALAFLHSKMPELIQSGVIPKDSSGDFVLDDGLKTALYRAFNSTDTGILTAFVTVPLVVSLTKDQRDFNEDRRH